jgi:hypothetical protein
MEQLVKALPLPLHHGDRRDTSAPEEGQTHGQYRIVTMTGGLHPTQRRLNGSAPIIVADICFVAMIDHRPAMIAILGNSIMRKEKIETRRWPRNYKNAYELD